MINSAKKRPSKTRTEQKAYKQQNVCMVKLNEVLVEKGQCPCTSPTEWTPIRYRILDAVRTGPANSSTLTYKTNAQGTQHHLSTGFSTSLTSKAPPLSAKIASSTRLSVLPTRQVTLIPTHTTRPFCLTHYMHQALIELQ